MLVCFLLNECGRLVDVDAETYAGFTAYQLAFANATSSNKKYQRIVAELVKHGADQTPIAQEDSDDDGDEVPTTVHNMYAEKSSCPVTLA